MLKPSVHSKFTREKVENWPLYAAGGIQIYKQIQSLGAKEKDKPLVKLKQPTCNRAVSIQSAYFL